MFALPSARSLLAACRPTAPHASPPVSVPPQVRFRSHFAPKKVKYVKRQKGLLPIPIGGSIKGTTIAFGDYGIRVKGNGMRISGEQLSAAEDAMKKAIKPVKGAKVYMRVFPDVPVCIKGNEARMGKGKGSFEYWSTRVPTGRVIFELGGVPIKPEIARTVLRLGAVKLPTIMEFITKDTPPRLGNLVLPREEIEKLECIPYHAP
ncbi:mitochondrial ribosomal protein L16 [Daedalea quercina L-15889]|uniref:Mitochondrial ribosomal protein L16 n=1 Tax=Daedalea quercina L-15889 TaxID=1314783 RepID=A0A165N5R9_9APHY|nr:mitochondrial ribosomal protein L16 [Daedalea quercina L-15889]